MTKTVATKAATKKMDERFRGLVTEFDAIETALPTAERDKHGQPVGEIRDRIIGLFTSLYCNTLDTWANTFWLGHQVAKSPLDLWIYQEIMWETAPTMIVETGSCIGGSALFFASIFDLMDTYAPNPEAARRGAEHVGSGRIVSVDKDPYDNQPVHDRCTFLVGDSASDEVAAQVHAAVAGESRIMVVLDSLHTYDHVAAELAQYANLVTPGCYLVVEDSNMAGESHQALLEFVAASKGAFVIDKSREKHMMTSNLDGWILRVS